MYVCDGNQARAAKFLGIPRTTLQHHLSAHGISASRPGRPKA
jgi:DNA-binding protein Fis